jgi:tRNA(Ile)-lysidine synthase
MKKTEQKVIKFIARHNLIAENDRILAAFSGGADSVFLLTFLFKFRKKYKIQVAAFHLNHMLRKKAAFNDEEFCRNFCSEHKIPFYYDRIDVKAAALNEGISVEEAGRNTRYSLLQQTAEKEGFHRIATGHNMDDNTETILLNLFKGTGIKGISGIPYTRGKIIRPLLNISKEDIRLYLQESEISYLTDKSNLTIDYERNFIRNKVIPLVQKRINPSLNEAVFRSSEVLKGIAGYIEKEVQNVSGEIIEEEGDILKLDLEKLTRMDSELIPEILKSTIERNFGVQLTFNDIQSVFSLVDKPSGKGTNLQGGIRAEREREHLVFYILRQEAATHLEITTGSHCKINGKTLFIEQWTKKIEISVNRNVEFISGDKLDNKFIIREWKRGDKFTPLGMSGSVKVSDFLNSQKIPLFKKKRELVLTDGKDIIWVIGHRINEKFKIKPDTQKVLKLCLK